VDYHQIKANAITGNRMELAFQNLLQAKFSNLIPRKGTEDSIEKLGG
jgi:hypothetical protein